MVPYLLHPFHGFLLLLDCVGQIRVAAPKTDPVHRYQVWIGNKNIIIIKNKRHEKTNSHFNTTINKKIETGGKKHTKNQKFGQIH